MLGVSAVHPDWKVYFTTAYFSQSMIEGSAFARQLGSTLEEEYYPPDWYGVARVYASMEPQANIPEGSLFLLAASF